MTHHTCIHFLSTYLYLPHELHTRMRKRKGTRKSAIKGSSVNFALAPNPKISKGFFQDKAWHVECFRGYGVVSSVGQVQPACLLFLWCIIMLLVPCIKPCCFVIHSLLFEMLSTSYWVMSLLTYYLLEYSTTMLSGQPVHNRVIP